MNLLLPYLRMLLLLTLSVGLLGHAKLLLVSNIGIDENILANHSQQSLEAIEPSIKLKTVYQSESLKESPKQRSASVSRELLEEASIDDAKPPLAEVIKNRSVDKNVSAEFSEMPSAELIRELEASMQAVQSRFEGYENPIISNPFFTNNDLAYQAELRLQSNVTYDGRYVKIAYPMGDVPSNIGVCTDVVIRALRGLGVDLQQRVHEDMKRNFRSYPNNWQLSRPDSNIDHRRVPNLMTYFKRMGASVGRISSNPMDYHAGDIVAWEMGNGLTHIGIVSTYVSEKTSNPLIVHNIGVGPEMTDILFDFKIIGHYKYGAKQDSLKLAQRN